MTWCSVAGVFILFLSCLHAQVEHVRIATPQDSCLLPCLGGQNASCNEIHGSSLLNGAAKHLLYAPYNARRFGNCESNNTVFALNRLPAMNRNYVQIVHIETRLCVTYWDPFGKAGLDLLNPATAVLFFALVLAPCQALGNGTIPTAHAAASSSSASTPPSPLPKTNSPSGLQIFNLGSSTPNLITLANPLLPFLATAPSSMQNFCLATCTQGRWCWVGQPGSHQQDLSVAAASKGHRRLAGGSVLESKLRGFTKNKLRNKQKKALVDNLPPHDAGAAVFLTWLNCDERSGSEFSISHRIIPINQVN